ncbi:MAG TPA: ABC transporter permease subunit [Nocardioides sp.]|uniref:ABC transporter permease n=1 Tax=Nocardioides sp. TaxID=35761 RepID=UPI002B6622FC|nr:ABC transporter permease subunit [Nocardioides sp.]HQR26317.1 ABC transporter permease subunit [Nocardioides sp.]
MATATLERPVEPGAPPPVPEEPRRVPRWALGLAVLAGWIVMWSFTKGENTMPVGGLDQTPFHERLADLGSHLSGSAFTQAIADFINAIVDWLHGLIAAPVPPRPAPTIGWLGVVAIVTWIGYAVANWRIALLILVSFLSFGVFGYWEDSMDLLIVTLVSVSFAVLIGFPMAVWIALSPRAARVLTLLLDLLQTMPTFVYLIFVVVLFGVGAATAVICTLAYALPPIVRISGFGIRDVSPVAIEATDSLGQTTWQRLTKVQIPMARKTIILGLNQTILAALSMAIIASYINGPGLGKPVLQALTQNDFGGGLVPGLLIVLMGIMLDRTTTAASERSERVARGGGENPHTRRLVLGGLLVPVAFCVWYSRYSLDAAIFPETEWGRTVADKADAWMESFVSAVDSGAGAFKDFVTYSLLNPMQELLANSPWWLSFLGLFLLALVIGGRKALLPSALCLTGLYFLDLWHDTMIVLNMTLVATLLVMVLALVFGVWMARSRAADIAIRPVLDAGQTIPAFVYLIPVLALFGSTRFTAIVAGIIYAAPAAIKLVADGVRGVSPGTVEAGRSTGSTKLQEITKVQLPMAKGSIVLATNQGLLYVLSMVVIGGLVGAQALGYDVVLGLAHSEYWGKGLAAGLSIVLLGIWIDRVARAAAERAGGVSEAAQRSLQLTGWRRVVFRGGW